MKIDRDLTWDKYIKKVKEGYLINIFHIDNK